MEDPSRPDRIIPMTTTATQPVTPPPPAASAPHTPHIPATGANRANRICRGVVTALRSLLGWTPFVGGPYYGSSMLAGGGSLAVMIVPYIAAVSREVLLAVPVSQREAALGLGASRGEAVWTAVLPYGRSGIIGAVMPGLGRALGETMAVTMLIR